MPVNFVRKFKTCIINSIIVRNKLTVTIVLHSTLYFANIYHKRVLVKFWSYRVIWDLRVYLKGAQGWFISIHRIYTFFIISAIIVYLYVISYNIYYICYIIFLLLHAHPKGYLLHLRELKSIKGRIWKWIDWTDKCCSIYIQK